MNEPLAAPQFQTSVSTRWIIILVMLNGIICMSWVASLAHRASTYRLSPGGLEIAGWAVIVAGIFYTAYPFALEQYFAKHPEALIAKGKHPREITFLIAAASAAVPCILALVYALVGGAISSVYKWAVVSLTVLSVWSWRYRDMLKAKEVA